MLRRLLPSSATSPEVGVLFSPEAAVLIPYPHPMVASNCTDERWGWEPEEEVSEAETEGEKELVCVCVCVCVD